MALFTLRFTGGDASRSEIDFYDVSKALIGFQRSLALTMHLVQNGEIITQAPSLKNCRILAAPPRQGSWEIVVGALFTASGAMALAPRDSAAGRATRALYDYVLKSIMGDDISFRDVFEDDFTAQINGARITESKVDSLIEKVEPAVVEMHRPIVWSGSAHGARVYFDGSPDKRVGPRFSAATYEHAARTLEGRLPVNLEAMISSYNSNTFKGRAYLPSEGRPIPFELSEGTRGRSHIQRITSSLSANALDRRNWVGEMAIRAFRRESVAGRLKSLYVVDTADHIDRLNG